MSRVLVTGSRSWADKATIHQALFVHARFGDTLIHGACPTGADAIAAAYWRAFGPREAHPADWVRHGKAAGPLRNIEMLESGIDVVVAFPIGESRGTRHCIREAQRRGLTVHIFERATS